MLIGKISRFVVTCAILLPSFTHSAPLLTVNSFRWTDSVDYKSKKFNKIYTTPAKVNHIFLWMQVNGSRELLEQLRTTPSGAFPVKHVWYRYNSSGVVSNGAVNLEVARKDELQKLSFEVDATGAFSWRIWSDKKFYGKGWWRVDLMYASNKPVMCVVNGVEKPCRFEIEVR